MTILTQTMNNVTKNFKETINKYDLNNLFSNGVINDFNHYINMIKFIDDISSTFSVSLYENFLYKIDEAFFNSSYRKQFCEVINLPKRTLITFYGEVTFKRRTYYDRNKKKEFCFVDEVLSLPSYISLDPFVCTKICEVSSHSSYAKTGKIVSEMIGKRMKFNDDPSREIISRALSRNIVLNFKIPDIPYTQKETPKILYVMLDEKWVHSQYNDDEDYMVKDAVVFENADLVYKYKKKKDSENRIELLGKQVLASIDNDLQRQVLDYIYYSYDTDQIDELYKLETEAINNNLGVWKEYTVTFIYNNQINIIKVKPGEHIEKFIPSKKGHEFIHWELNDKEFNFDLEIESDITLTAKFEINSEILTIIYIIILSIVLILFIKIKSIKRLYKISYE